MPFPPRVLKSPIPSHAYGPSFLSKSHPKPRLSIFLLNCSYYSIFACKGLEFAAPKPVSSSPSFVVVLDCRLSVGAKHVNVAILGNLCVDIILNVPQLPLPSVEERKAFMERLASSPPDKEAGGNCNMAIAVARLGLGCISIGHMGNEIYGKFLSDVLHEEGISMVGISNNDDVVNNFSAYFEALLCWVLVDPLQRHGFCSRADFSKEPTFHWMSKLSKEVKIAIKNSKVLYCNGYGFDELSPVRNAYKEIDPKPLVFAPGGFFDTNWFKEFISKLGKSLDIVSHHIYNLGLGVDEHLVEKILDPSYLDGEASTFRGLKNILESSATSATTWFGKAGGAYNSDHHLVSDAFVYSFCALLWHQLMGRCVLSTTFSGTNKIRAYAHYAKQSKRITILLINLDNNTTVEVEVTLNSTTSLWHRKMSDNPKVRELHFYFAGKTTREEYLLTPQDGTIYSQIMILNRNTLIVNSDGDIPPLKPLYVNASNPIWVAPFSIIFAHIPDAVVTACSLFGCTR